MPLRPAQTEALERYAVRQRADSAWQARLRLQQSVWREAAGLQAGSWRGATLGSRLTDEDGTQGRNFVDATAVRQALSGLQHDALVDRHRLETNLLSSQPLAFNLFALLALDLPAATRVMRHLLPGEITRVTGIRFEHSPGRGDARFLDNGTAFDVAVEYRSMSSARGLLGIEVKLHEDLHDPVPPHRRRRYDEVADRSTAFSSTDGLWAAPLWQLWLDHLLLLSAVQAGEYDTGTTVLVAPAGNPAVRRAAADYQRHLRDGSTFRYLTVEEVLVALLLEVDGAWVHALWSRYGDQGALVRAGWT